MKRPIFPYAKLIAHVLVSYDMLDNDPDAALEAIKADVWKSIADNIECLRKEAKKFGIKPSERLRQMLAERFPDSDEPVIITSGGYSKVGLTEDA